MHIIRATAAPVSYRIVAVKRGKSPAGKSKAAVFLVLLHLALGVILAMASFNPPEDARQADYEATEEIIDQPVEDEDNEILLIKC